MATRRKKSDPAEAPVVTPAPAPNGEPAKPPRAPRRKPAVERIPEQVTVDFHGVREQLQQSTAGAAQAEREVREACELAAQMRERLRQAEAEANSAVVQINRARDQAEEAARLHREAERRARKAETEAEHALQTAREVGRRLRTSEDQHQAAWEEALRELGEDIQLVRQRRVPAKKQKHEPPPPPADAPPAGAVELVPDDEPGRDEAVLHASVRSEAPGERLVRHLDELLRVKAAVRDVLSQAADGSFDRAIVRPLRRHRELTEQQSEELEARLRALGGEPPGDGKGLFSRLAGWAFDGWGREPDDLDRTVHGVWKAMAGQGLEMAMSQWLAPLARAMGDETTARLAERHWRQKEGAVAELRGFLVPVAELAALLNEVARVARQPLKIEAAVAPEGEASAVT